MCVCVCVSVQHSEVLTAGEQTCTLVCVWLPGFDGWAGTARPWIRVQTNWLINDSHTTVVMGGGGGGGAFPGSWCMPTIRGSHLYKRNEEAVSEMKRLWRKWTWKTLVWRNVTAWSQHGQSGQSCQSVSLLSVVELVLLRTRTHFITSSVFTHKEFVLAYRGVGKHGIEQ